MKEMIAEAIGYDFSIFNRSSVPSSKYDNENQSQTLSNLEEWERLRQIKFWEFSSRRSSEDFERISMCEKQLIRWLIEKRSGGLEYDLINESRDDELRVCNFLTYLHNFGIENQASNSNPTFTPTPTATVTVTVTAIKVVP